MLDLRVCAAHDARAEVTLQLHIDTPAASLLDVVRRALPPLGPPPATLAALAALADGPTPAAAKPPPAEYRLRFWDANKLHGGAPLSAEALAEAGATLSTLGLAPKASLLLDSRHPSAAAAARRRRRRARAVGAGGGRRPVRARADVVAVVVAADKGGVRRRVGGGLRVSKFELHAAAVVGQAGALRSPRRVHREAADVGARQRRRRLARPQLAGPPPLLVGRLVRDPSRRRGGAHALAAAAVVGVVGVVAALVGVVGGGALELERAQRHGVGDGGRARQQRSARRWARAASSASPPAAPPPPRSPTSGAPSTPPSASLGTFRGSSSLGAAARSSWRAAAAPSGGGGGDGGGGEDGAGDAATTLASLGMRAGDDLLIERAAAADAPSLLVERLEARRSRLNIFFNALGSTDFCHEIAADAREISASSSGACAIGWASTPRACGCAAACAARICVRRRRRWWASAARG